MTEFFLVNDVHLSDRAPASCTDTYLDDLFDLLRQVADKAAHVDGTIILAGDVFHHKAPSRTSHATVMRLIDWARQALVPVYAVAGNHDLCVSDDSEALTDDGWKRFEELTGDERFATLNPETHAFEWQKPTTFYRMPYRGEMIHFTGRRVDHLVTPNHEVYVRTNRRSRRTGQFEWRKRRAADAPAYNYWLARTASASWAGSADEVVVVPACESRRRPAFWVPVAVAAEFFGWYLSEGSVEAGRVVISQSREANPEKYAEIVDLIKSMGLKAQLSKKTIRISSAPLAEFLLREFGTGSSKLGIPRWIKEWPTDLLNVMLGAYRKGDGTSNGKSAWSARTASDQLADDLQEIGAKVGIGVTISAIREFSFRGTSYVGRARTLGFSKSEVTLYKPERVAYDDMVWCPRLPNGIWMVRRNGRALWTGNSHDRVASLFESQPLGVVCTSGAIDVLDGWEDTSLDPVYGVPWLMTFDDANVSDALADYRAELLKGRLREEPYLVVTHAPLYPPGHELKYEFYPAASWAKAMGGFGTVHYGHVHEPHGIYTVDGVTFSNPGALSRGSLHEHNLNRTPSIAVWNSETGEIRHEQLNAKPSAEVFRLAEANEKKSAEINLNRFLESIQATRLDVTSTGSVLEHVRQAHGEDPALVAVIEKLLQESS